VSSYWWLVLETPQGKEEEEEEVEDA